MSHVSPHPAYGVRETPEAFVVELRSPRRPITAFVLAAWLVGWALGLVFVVQSLLEASAPALGDRAFLVVWVGLWLAAGVAAMAWLAWVVAGRERVTVSATELRIRRSALGAGFTRRYPLAGIAHLRTFGRDLPPLLAMGLDVSGQGASGVQFEYGGRIVRFARVLDERTAHGLVGLLRSHAFGGRPGDPAVPAA